LPAVSVVIPTYKHRDFILDTVNSVLSQTFRDFEIIVVNDGSPDDTASLLRPMAESGMIRYVEQSNAAAAAARNRGLEMARGKFIAFLDDDDLWPQDKLEWQVLALSNSPDLSVIGGALCVIDKNGNELEVLLANDRMITFESLFSGNPFYSPGQTLIRTDRFRAIGGFDTSIWGADDLDAWFRLRQTGELKFVNRIALRYRQHPLNASNDVRRIATQSLKVMKRHVRSAAPVQQRLLMARGRLYLYKYVFKKTLINWSAFRVGAPAYRSECRLG